MTTIYDEGLYALRQRLLREYSRPWTVQEMADTLELSPSYFTALYRRLFHDSPKNDLLNIRITAAKLKLRVSNNTVQQIAVDCGFQNEYYFSILFKKRTGFPPTSYRSNFVGERIFEPQAQ